jgi:Transposase DDE domain
LVKRFAKAPDWLGRLLWEAIGRNEQERLPGLTIDLVDATTANRQGAKGPDHRLHLRVDLARNRVVEAELTDVKGGETLDRFATRRGGVVIADAGYAHRGPLGRIAERGAHFIVRFGWSTMPLENDAGEALDLLTTLETLPEAEPGEFPVFFRTPEGSRIASVWWRSARASLQPRRPVDGFGTSTAGRDVRWTRAPCSSPVSRSF